MSRMVAAFPVEFDGMQTDAESVGMALDRLMRTALSTPGILDEHGPVAVGPCTVDVPAEGRPEVGRMLDLSTGHIPQGVMLAAKDAEDGAVDCGDHRVQPHDHGWIVLLLGLEENELAEAEPEWFRPIGDMARKHDCILVMFDEIGEEAHGLPVYEW